ncbi:hypothetical protein Tco_1563992 [Tanacetum coccineum]
MLQSMHVNKSFNRNPANHRLSHALMEALIEDENAIDKGVADTVKGHKRKHDDKDDDDEDPPTRPNQGKKAKRRITKESESSKKPSSTKQTPKGKTPTKGSKTGKSTLEKDPVEEPIAEVIIDDASDDVAHDDNPPQDTSEHKPRKTLNPDWFKQPLRPPTPNPEWNKRQDPLTFNDLIATPIHFSKYVLNGLKIENLTQDILLGPALNLLKGTCSSRPPGHRNIAADYFFNNYLEYLKTSNPEVTYTTSIMKRKAARNEIKGIKDMVLHFGLPSSMCMTKILKRESSTGAILGVKSVSVKKLHGYGHLEEIVVKRYDQQLYKFKEDVTLKSVRDEIHYRVLDFHMDYNPEMPKRKWTIVDRKRSGHMIELIDKQLREREIIRNLERLVGARELEMDYQFMTRTV